MDALVRVESNGNPYAIGVVKGRLARQPRNKNEAIATARALEQGGWNFSMGIGQVNRYNLARYGLSYETAFDSCDNLKAASAILSECYRRAASDKTHKYNALGAALSCYYSGNFSTGYRHGYVQKVIAHAQEESRANDTPTVPAIPVIPHGKTLPKPTAKAKVVVQPANKSPPIPGGEMSAPQAPSSPPERNPALVF